MKLENSGMHSKMIDVVCSWLEERQASVVVDGVSSPCFSLTDSVYQGTTWGPPLWNFFFADARFAIQDANFIETIFADDLNAFRGFPTALNNDHVMKSMAKCQKSLHSWGNANQVAFDPAKEHFSILHPQDNYGENFKLLGISFDTKLKMEQGISEIVAQSHHRVSMVLRCRRFNPLDALVRFY